MSAADQVSTPFTARYGERLLIERNEVFITDEGNRFGSEQVPRFVICYPELFPRSGGGGRKPAGDSYYPSFEDRKLII